MGLVDIRGKMQHSRGSSVIDLQVTPRKKRTFDIAFLTGQSENSSEGTTASTISPGSSTSSSKKPISLGIGLLGDTNNFYDREFSRGPEGENLRLLQSNETTSSSTTTAASSPGSSIDIMTNGSFVTSEDSESPAPDFSPGISRKPTAKPHKSRQSVNNNNRPEIKSSFGDTGRKLVDINQMSSGRSGKDNLPSQSQFSGLLPIPTTTTHSGHPGGYADFRLPHLASTFVFLPQMQMAKFPLHFPGSAVKSGAELTNYGGKGARGGFPTEQQYIAAAAATAAAYPYHYPGFMLQEPHLPRTPGPDNHHSQNRHQGSSQQQQQQQSQSGPSGNVATLLPPSLTALSLPAQNVCAKCNIGFRMTSDLVYHMRSHHKRETDPMKKRREDKLKCPVCHETFRERHHLTRHMTAHQDRAEEIELERNKLQVTVTTPV